jgi:lipoprotein-anchoring transpeptidase ErfK/SrfK
MGPVRRRSHILVLLCTLAAVALVAPALAAGKRERGAAASTGCVRGSVHGMRTAQLSYAAQAVRPLAALRTPGGSVLQRFELKNVNGAATVFGVLAERVDRSCRATSYWVQLPMRPNGATGWVRASDVQLSTVHTRITVDLSQRRVTLYRDGRSILVTTAVIGAPSTPTPTGRYYVNQRLLAANPTGAYGPGAVGISAFSPVLQGWAQGGPVAIHGTDAPDMIGFAVSHGCVRILNSAIRQLLRLAEEGTPVEIRM